VANRIANPASITPINGQSTNPLCADRPRRGGFSLGARALNSRGAEYHRRVVGFASVVAVSTSGNFVIGPNLTVIGFSVLVLIAAPCGIVTAAKGRWGWLALGVLTSGLLWIVGATQPPRPGSLWLRLAARRSRGLRAT
jgi:hypothetical protein